MWGVGRMPLRKLAVKAENSSVPYCILRQKAAASWHLNYLNCSCLLQHTYFFLHLNSKSCKIIGACITFSFWRMLLLLSAESERWIGCYLFVDEYEKYAVRTKFNISEHFKYILARTWTLRKEVHFQGSKFCIIRDLEGIVFLLRNLVRGLCVSVRRIIKMQTRI
jgi:hypothetical protein